MATRIELIQREVADYFEVKPRDLVGQSRNPWYTRPRMVAMYLARKLIKMSYPEIGRRFGGRDHSTVMFAVKKIDRLHQEDTRITKAITVIESRLSALEPV